MNFHTVQGEGSTNKWEIPKKDVNAPDLYIPLMSFITYVLLVGYCKGASNKFTPEVLIQAVTRCLALQVYFLVLILPLSFSIFLRWFLKSYNVC